MKVDEYNRLTGILLEMNPELTDLGESVFVKTEKKLKSLTLSIRCGPRLSTSYAHQACLITAVNCGKRSFQGGVFVEMDNECTCLLPGFEGMPLSEVIKFQGGILQNHHESTKVLFIGETGQSSSGLHLIFSNWTGGFVKTYDSVWDKDVSFPLGAICAAALGVAASFLTAMGIEPLADWKPQGISFWNPDRLDWQTPDPAEPTPKYFPKSLWLLGLGHLGQAYAWTIGLLPFKGGDSLFLLQDYDVATLGNYEAGMLCERNLTNIKKARIVSEFLEKRGHKTSIVERRYTNTFARLADDPELMISGLDNALSRRNLRVEEFKGILDFGLGGNLGTFDLIRFHNLPFAGRPEEIWPQSADQDLRMDALEKLTRKINDCGFVKGIAVSFVGVFVSCLAVSELLRAYHQGPKVIKANISLRQLSMRNLIMGDRYKFEFFSGQIEFKSSTS